MTDEDEEKGAVFLDATRQVTLRGAELLAKVHAGEVSVSAMRAYVKALVDAYNKTSDFIVGDLPSASASCACGGCKKTRQDLN